MWAALGAGMLNQLFMNTSNRIGTGASLRRQQLREQERQVRKEAAAGIIGRVEGAKAAGIHPLVAMGSNVGGTSLPIGNSFNQAGEFAAAAAQRQVADRELRMRREELEYNRQQEAKAAAERASKEALEAQETAARIKLIEAQEAAERKRMTDSDRDFAAAQAAHAQQIASRSNAVRVPARARTAQQKPIPEMYVPVRDRYGKINYIPNPDIYDLELPDSVGAGTLLLPEAEPFWKRADDWWEEFKAKDRARRKGVIVNPDLPTAIDW